MTKQYWTECISAAADDCGLKLTTEQLECLVETVKISHENYGMAFYEPPATDRIAEIERQYEAKLQKQQAEHDKYVRNAETAVKKALRTHSDAKIFIEDHGSVYLVDGRTTQIQ